jgi:hypothetical protein
MRNRKLVVALGVLTMCVAVGVHAQYEPGPTKKATHDAYYSDSTFTVLVGEDGIACDGTQTLWGTSSDYRIRCMEDCRYGTINCRCQQNISGTWTEVECSS